MFDNKVDNRVILGRMTEEVERFVHGILGTPIPGIPSLLTDIRRDFRANCILEELAELKDATTVQDQADAFMDIAYYALGALVEMGVAPVALFEEVHGANMRKHRGALSKRPGSQGYDAVKPAGWQGPDVEALLSLRLKDVPLMRKLQGTCCQDYEGHTNEFEPTPVHGAKIQADFDLTWIQCQDLKKANILVIGNARHGKDTVCEMLRDGAGLNFISTSRFCAEHVVFPVLGEKYGYKDAEECLNDRGNHRGEWFTLIREYNRDDETSLATGIFATSSIYCGLRSRTEFEACKAAGLFDLILWVDASGRGLPAEASNSMQLAEEDTDFTVSNNGSLEDLHQALQRVLDNSQGLLRYRLAKNAKLRGATYK